MQDRCKSKFFRVCRWAVKEPVGLLIAAARRRMKRAVTQLLRRKLVRAEGDSSDRRRLRLRVTAAARAKLPPLRLLAAELRGAAVHGLTAHEEDALRMLLRKIIANLDAMVGP